MNNDVKTVLVTGGAGYVGSVLVPKLLKAGYRVKVLDLFIYGEHVLNEHHENPNLKIVKGDIRDQKLLKEILPGCGAVIHLACISNDPSFELNPKLGRSINFEAFRPLVEISKQIGINRFIYASSSSVYGIKSQKNVHEGMALKPLTDYSRFKADCENILAEYQSDDFTTVTIRPATVCGYSPRLRLDLTVNILTNHAVNKGRITVFGGEQRRPNIHVDDITDLYVNLLNQPNKEIAGKIWNAGYQNNKVKEIAEIVQNVIGNNSVEIVVTPTDDNRSYHISSEKIKMELGFKPKRSIEDAVADLKKAFNVGNIPNPLGDIRYYNIKTMQANQMR